MILIIILTFNANLAWECVCVCGEAWSEDPAYCAAGRQAGSCAPRTKFSVKVQIAV